MPDNKSVLPKNWDNYVWRAKWEWLMTNYDGEDEEGLYCPPDDAPEEIKKEYERLRKIEAEYAILGIDID